MLFFARSAALADLVLVLTGKFPINDDGTVAIDARNLQVPKPQIGVYRLRVTALATSELLAATLDASKPFAALLVYNESPVSIVTHLASYDLDVGKPVGLVTRAVDARSLAAARANATLPRALRSAVTHAEMIVIAPDGSERELTMHDDGLHNDLAAHDGVFGATFTPSSSGGFVLRAQISGANAGRAFQRSTQHYVRVARVDAELSGTATLGMQQQQSRLVAKIDVKLNKQRAAAATSGAPLRLHAYAELWRGGKGVAWAMSAVDVSGGVAELSFDARWLRAPGLRLDQSAPFELRHVYISELDGFVPLAHTPLIQPKQALTRLSSQLAAVWPSLAAPSHLYNARAASLMDDDSLWFGPRPKWFVVRCCCCCCCCCWCTLNR
jgi:hypothetical protein